MFPLPIHLYFELTALLVVIVCWPALKSTVYRFFLFYLTFIVCVELSGRYIRKMLHQPNAWIYNISIPVEFLFYAFIFWKHYTATTFQELGKWFLLLFPGFVLGNLFINGMAQVSPGMITVGCFFMILFSLLFLYDLYLRDYDAVIWKDPMFWISTGVLLFNAGELTYNLFSSYLIMHHADQAAIIFTQVNNKLIWVLYSFLIVAFLCLKTTKRYRKA